MPALRQTPGSIRNFGLRRARNAETQAGLPRRGLRALTIAIGEGPLLREKPESALARVLFLVAQQIATRAITFYRGPPQVLSRPAKERSLSPHEVSNEILAWQSRGKLDEVGKAQSRERVERLRSIQGEAARQSGERLRFGRRPSAAKHAVVSFGNFACNCARSVSGAAFDAVAYNQAAQFSSTGG